MRRTVIVGLACSLLLSSSGCSLFVGPLQEVAVSAPDDAEVVVNGKVVGKGNVNVKLQRDITSTIMARNGDKHATVIVTGGKWLSTTGILDTFFGILLLVPLLGLTSSGAWKLDQDRVTLSP